MRSQTAGKPLCYLIAYVYRRSAPLGSVYALLERHLQAESSQNDDAWWRGGIMERLTKHLGTNNTVGAAAAAREHQRRTGMPILFVYDLVSVECEFSSLRFVRDAVQPPVTGAAFEQTFGLPRHLSFGKRLERSVSTVDFWEGIYA